MQGENKMRKRTGQGNIKLGVCEKYCYGCGKFIKLTNVGHGGSSHNAPRTAFCTKECKTAYRRRVMIDNGLLRDKIGRPAKKEGS